MWSRLMKRMYTQMSIDSITCYGHPNGIFQMFHAIVNHSYDALYIGWISQPNFGVQYEEFQIFPHMYSWFISKTQ